MTFASDVRNVDGGSFRNTVMSSIAARIVGIMHELEPAVREASKYFRELGLAAKQAIFLDDSWKVILKWPELWAWYNQNYAVYMRTPPGMSPPELAQKIDWSK